MNSVLTATQKKENITNSELHDILINTLKCTVSSEILLEAVHRAQIILSWQRETEEDFSATKVHPLRRKKVATANTMPAIKFWMAYGVWCFCEACGRRTLNPSGAPTSSLPKNFKDLGCRAEHSCKSMRTDCGKIRSANPGDLLSTDECYFCPQKEDWPLYDVLNGHMVDMLKEGALVPPGPSLLDFEKDELKQLSVVELFCERWRYSQVHRRYWAPGHLRSPLASF